MDKTGVLLELAERVAKQNYSGHLTILRFTTHWKVCFGTPNLDAGARDEVGNLSDYESLEDALFHLLYDSISCEDCACSREDVMPKIKRQSIGVNKENHRKVSMRDRGGSVTYS